MRRKSKVYINAPITLSFSLICCLALLLDYITEGVTTQAFFSTYGTSWFNLFTYIRLIGHVFGHASFSHLIGNLLYILLLGPMLEEKYHERLILVIVTTALVTGICHNILEPNVMLLGASGVVFAFILLSSITGQEEGIPITLLLVAALWLGQEILAGLTSLDNVSQLTHIIGGLSGAALGLKFKRY